ncbi:hypothetical protein ACFFIF_02460 [Vagococcus entomophilus]|uniref:Uncharacterized protein n=1 Tax=Vagococcus entomophilus TaxID=1160095 RepID=A0A430AJS0_9ENTE|nr:hypothetical protein [Vagococcus entomophilus]RSU08341.1 hypothetical protein CBF30_03620 [Vagococcus entomophilus]
MNGNRISQLIDNINKEKLLSRTTKDLLKEQTIALYYLLRATCKHRDDLLYYQVPDKSVLFHRISFVLENILLEREDSFPKRLTNRVLHKKLPKFRNSKRNLF